MRRFITAKQRPSNQKKMPKTKPKSEIEPVLNENIFPEGTPPRTEDVENSEIIH
jgi:hypothetical protein